MNDVALVRKKSMPPPTPLEELLYTKSMLRELLPKVAQSDALLHSLIEMAFLQACDLLAGQVPMRPNVSPQNASIKP
jgi:hypothetical protein